jgi:hypothetical protein
MESEIKTEIKESVEIPKEEIVENVNTMITLRKTTAQRLMALKQLGESYDDVLVKLLDERTDKVV